MAEDLDLSHNYRVENLYYLVEGVGDAYFDAGFDLSGEQMVDGAQGLEKIA